MDTPVLYIVRHGRTELNVANKFRGNIDAPLAPEGVKDGEEAAEFLESLNIDPSFMVSSDKIRATETADIIKKHFPIEVTTTSDLRAWNLGDFSGKPKDKENLDELERYIKNPDTPVNGGESLNDFRSRVIPALQECFEQALINGLGIVIAHSSIIHEIGTQLTEDHKSLVVKPGGVVRVGFKDGNITADRIFKPLSPEDSAASVS